MEKAETTWLVRLGGVGRHVLRTTDVVVFAKNGPSHEDTEGVPHMREVCW